MGFFKSFMKGMARANNKPYGDIEGSITGLKSGKRSISIEGGKIVAWIVDEDDIVINKADVKSMDFKANFNCKDIASSGGKLYNVDVYHIEFNNGKSGTLRVIKK